MRLLIQQNQIRLKETEQFELSKQHERTLSEHLTELIRKQTKK